MPVVGSTSRATVADSPLVTNIDDSVDDDGVSDDRINNIGGTRGVWYKVLGSNNVPLVASTCHSGTTFDTVLSVYHLKMS